MVLGGTAATCFTAINDVLVCVRACSVLREAFVCWYFVCVRARGPQFADISAGTRANVAVIAATEFQEDFLLDADVASPKHAPYQKKIRMGISNPTTCIKSEELLSSRFSN